MSEELKSPTEVETPEAVEKPKKAPKKKEAKKPVVEPEVITPADPIPAVEAAKETPKTTKCKCDGAASTVRNRLGTFKVCLACGKKK